MSLPLESFLTVAALTAALIWYALVLARKEGRDSESGSRRMMPAAGSSRRKPAGEGRDPDAHLGHSGAE